MNPYEVVKRPRITEKQTLLAEKQGKMVFEVDPNANKIQIKQAIHQVFGNKPLSVNIVNIPPKQKRFKGRLGKTPRLKKAIVTFRPGDEVKIENA
jgi:large subunit ribosomal protein L23